MPFVNSVANKFGQRLLFERSCMPVRQPLGRAERRYQDLGDDQIPDAKGGKDRSRKSANVDDPSLAIQSLQRFQGMSIVAKFAVIIVLHDDCVPAFRPTQQSNAPGKRKNGASWELVRWRDKRQMSIRRQL